MDASLVGQGFMSIAPGNCASSVTSHVFVNTRRCLNCFMLDAPEVTNSAMIQEEREDEWRFKEEVRHVVIDRVRTLYPPLLRY
jgi:hypothetical protein